ncbi:MAG: hypothetical protein KDE15_13485 [Erythrobacter sp.]|nr:hypothetical protein [Erythrobacter sp.]
MRARLLFVVTAIALPVFPAMAGLPVSTPGPEVGAGLGALAALSAGYTWLRVRARRG